LKEIGYSALSCSQLEEVVIGEGITEIDNVFSPSSCSALKSVTLPYSLLSIKGGISNNPELVIYCYRGSYGEHYAVQNGVSYSYLEGMPFTDVYLPIGSMIQ